MSPKRIRNPSVRRPVNRAFHVLMAAVVGVEAAGIAWELARGDSTLLQRIAAALTFVVGFAATWRVSWEPEKEHGTEVAEAVVEQDMRGIPRWWGTVPLVVATLGACWAWLALT